MESVDIPPDTLWRCVLVEDVCTLGSLSGAKVRRLLMFCQTFYGGVSVVQAMKEGSAEGLDRCLQEHQIRFIQAGTYLLLEKLKNSVYRRLFRRVALLHKEQEPAKAAQVPLGVSLILLLHLIIDPLFHHAVNLGCEPVPCC